MPLDGVVFIVSYLTVIYFVRCPANASRLWIDLIVLGALIMILSVLFEWMYSGFESILQSAHKGEFAMRTIISFGVGTSLVSSGMCSLFRKTKSNNRERE